MLADHTCNSLFFFLLSNLSQNLLPVSIAIKRTVPVPSEITYFLHCKTDLNFDYPQNALDQLTSGLNTIADTAKDVANTALNIFGKGLGIFGSSFKNAFTSKWMLGSRNERCKF